MSRSMKLTLAFFALFFVAHARGDVECELFRVDIQYDPNAPVDPNVLRPAHEIHCAPDGSDEFFAIDLPEGFSIRDHPFVSVIGGNLNRETARVVQPPGSSISASQRGGNRRGASGRRAVVTGTKTVLIVKVIVADGSATSTETELADSVFGTSGDPVNLKSQYSDCSHGQLTFTQAASRTNGAFSISNGATTVNLPSQVVGNGDATIRNAVTTELNNMFGMSASSLADHVMYCLPSASMTGIAYAYINSWNSVYSDKWCTYVSGQLHEIGHNLNLAHSNENGAAYNDQTGMMGYSYGSSDTPVMCFNAAKHYQLGWYGGCAKPVSSSSSPATKFEMIAPAEYTTQYSQSCASNQAVVLMVADGTTGGYYMQYNKKTGLNSGTQEAGNQVIVNYKTGSFNTYGESDLVAKLSSGGSYTGTAGGTSFTIKWCSGDGLSTSTPVILGVGTSADPCVDQCAVDADCDDGNWCNGPETCSNGVCVAGPAPCSVYPAATCMAATETCEYCGDGIIQAGEQCDDSNTVSNDGCSATCQNEYCGDGIIQAGEQCDDSNSVSNDGCSATCQNEYCGDGIIQAGEQCDDSNSVSNDGCSATCQNEYCGDGVRQSSEQCDDGNSASLDGCDSSCKNEVCGDGIINNNGAEECDGTALGNHPGCLDGCTSAAKECGANCKWITSCADNKCTADEENVVSGQCAADVCSDCVIDNTPSVVCGDGLCDASQKTNGLAKEDWSSCPLDCPSVSSGKPNTRWYCGNNDALNQWVGCQPTKIDGSPAGGGADCGNCESSNSGSVVCCGDGTCDALESPETCPGDCQAECAVDGDCSSGTFCNGPETCDAGTCVPPSTSTCSAGQICDDINSRCVECVADSDCDDGNSCNGVETCDASSGTCGAAPQQQCDQGLLCDPDTLTCVECNVDLDCASGEVCSSNSCGPAGCPAGSIFDDAQYPGCCCTSNSQLSGKKADRFCNDYYTDVQVTDCTAPGAAAAVQGQEKSAAEDVAPAAKGTGTAVLQGVVAILAVVVLVQAVSMAFLVRQRRGGEAEVSTVQAIKIVSAPGAASDLVMGGGREAVSAIDAIYDRRNLSSSSRSNLLAGSPETDTPKGTIQIV